MENNQALQTALELSMLNLSGASCGSPTAEQLLGEDGVSLRVSRSQNITHCVPVPSSEHVAEIVGRQGKAIHDWVLYTKLLL